MEVNDPPAEPGAFINLGPLKAANGVANAAPIPVSRSSGYCGVAVAAPIIMATLSVAAQNSIFSWSSRLSSSSCRWM